jgi:3-methyladenine DNA glycosylase/8-oxoguanine DNA glycosylase
MTVELRLSAQAPFSLSAVVDSHGWASLAPFDTNAQHSELTYVDRLNIGRIVELVIRQASEGVIIEVTDALGQAERGEVTDKVRWMLGLDQDFSDFYTLVRDEPKLAHVIEGAKGRVLRCPTLFEDTVKTILTTNTSWGGTIRMVEGVVSGFGDPLPADPSRRAFPTPEQLVAVDENTLRSAAGLGYRAPYVLELAEAVASGSLGLGSLRTTDAPTAEVRQQLLAIKGVGSYAAANLLMLLGRYDFVPVDSWAQKMVSHEWYEGEPVGRAEVEAAFEGWGEWKGLAFWFWDWSYGSET